MELADSAIKQEVTDEPEYVYFDESVCRVKLEVTDESVILPEDDEMSRVGVSRPGRRRGRPPRRGSQTHRPDTNPSSSSTSSTLTRRILPCPQIQLNNYNISAAPDYNLSATPHPISISQLPPAAPNTSAKPSIGTTVVQQSGVPNVQQSCMPTNVQQSSMPNMQQSCMPTNIQQSCMPNIQQSSMSNMQQSCMPTNIQQSCVPTNVQQSCLQTSVQQSCSSNVQAVQQSFTSGMPIQTAPKSPVGVSVLSPGRKILPRLQLIQPQQKEVTIRQLHPIPSSQISAALAIPINQLQRIGPSTNCNIFNRPIQSLPLTVPISQLNKTTPTHIPQDVTYPSQKRKAFVQPQQSISAKVAFSASAKVKVFAAKTNELKKPKQSSSMIQGCKLLPKPQKSIRPSTGMIFRSPPHTGLPLPQLTPLNPATSVHQLQPIISTASQTQPVHQITTVSQVSPSCTIPAQQTRNINSLSGQHGIALQSLQNASLSNHSLYPQRILPTSAALPLGQPQMTSLGVQSAVTLQQTQAVCSESSSHVTSVQHLQTVTTAISTQSAPVQLQNVSSCSQQIIPLQQLTSVSSSNTMSYKSLLHPVCTIAPITSMPQTFSIQQQQAFVLKQMKAINNSSNEEPKNICQESHSSQDTEKVLPVHHYSAESSLTPKLPLKVETRTLPPLTPIKRKSASTSLQSQIEPTKKSELASPEIQGLSYPQSSQEINQTGSIIQAVPSCHSDGTVYVHQNSIQSTVNITQGHNYTQSEPSERNYTQLQILKNKKPKSVTSPSRIHSSAPLRHRKCKSRQTSGALPIQVHKSVPSKKSSKSPYQTTDSRSISKQKLKSLQHHLSLTSRKKKPIIKVGSVLAYSLKKNLKIHKKNLFMPTHSVALDSNSPAEITPVASSSTKKDLKLRKKRLSSQTQSKAKNKDTCIPEKISRTFPRPILPRPVSGSDGSVCVEAKPITTIANSGNVTTTNIYTTTVSATGTDTITDSNTGTMHDTETDSDYIANSDTSTILDSNAAVRADSNPNTITNSDTACIVNSETTPTTLAESNPTITTIASSDPTTITTLANSKSITIASSDQTTVADSDTSTMAEIDTTTMYKSGPMITSAAAKPTNSTPINSSNTVLSTATTTTTTESMKSIATTSNCNIVHNINHPTSTNIAEPFIASSSNSNTTLDNATSSDNTNISVDTSTSSFNNTITNATSAGTTNTQDPITTSATTTTTPQLHSATSTEPCTSRTIPPGKPMEESPSTMSMVIPVLQISTSSLMHKTVSCDGKDFRTHIKKEVTDSLHGDSSSSQLVLTTNCALSSDETASRESSILNEGDENSKANFKIDSTFEMESKSLFSNAEGFSEAIRNFPPSLDLGECKFMLKEEEMDFFEEDIDIDFATSGASSFTSSSNSPFEPQERLNSEHVGEAMDCLESSKPENAKAVTDTRAIAGSSQNNSHEALLDFHMVKNQEHSKTSDKIPELLNSQVSKSDNCKSLSMHKQEKYADSYTTVFQSFCVKDQSKSPVQNCSPDSLSRQRLRSSTSVKQSDAFNIGRGRKIRSCVKQSEADSLRKRKLRSSVEPSSTVQVTPDGFRGGTSLQNSIEPLTADDRIIDSFKKGRLRSSNKTKTDASNTTTNSLISTSQLPFSEADANSYTAPTNRLAWNVDKTQKDESNTTTNTPTLSTSQLPSSEGDKSICTSRLVEHAEWSPTIPHSSHQVQEATTNNQLHNYKVQVVEQETTHESEPEAEQKSAESQLSAAAYRSTQAKYNHNKSIISKPRSQTKLNYKHIIKSAKLKRQVESQKMMIRKLWRKVNLEQRKNKRLQGMLPNTHTINTQDKHDYQNHTTSKSESRKKGTIRKCEYANSMSPLKRLKKHEESVSDDRNSLHISVVTSCGIVTCDTVPSSELSVSIPVEKIAAALPCNSLISLLPNPVNEATKTLVQNFMLLDDVSKVSEITNETETVRHRWHYLPVLHRRFMADCHYFCTQESFVSCIPENLKKLSADDMNDSFCIRCQNPELKFQSLIRTKYLNIVMSFEDILCTPLVAKSLIYSLNLLRRHKNLLTYTKWIINTTNNGQQVPQRVTCTNSVGEVASMLGKEIVALTKHLGKIYHQYLTMYDVKSQAQISPHHAVIQTEWSPPIILHTLGENGLPKPQEVVSLQCGYLWSQTYSTGYVAVSNSGSRTGDAVYTSLKYLLDKLLKLGIKMITIITNPETRLILVQNYGNTNNIQIKFIFFEPGHGAGAAVAVGNSVTQLICNTINAKGAANSISTARDVYNLISRYSSNLVYYYGVRESGQYMDTGTNKLIKPLPW